ncbi:MAG: hypothetical protein R3301_10540 [Saprospiraceae bacterium]|nr:hypothetical protein [Saprospiraceae bacterium]
MGDQRTLQAKTRQELAEEYGISRNTLARRLKMAGIDLPRGRIYPHDLRRIYRVLGDPRGTKYK